MSSDSKKKKSWFWRFIRRSLLLLIIVVGVGGWFLPQIISQTSLKNTLLNQLLGDAPGSVRVDSVDLAWNKPISIHGLKVYDDQKKNILSAEKIQTEKTLWTLAQNYQEIGMVTINKPDGHLIVRADGTNIGDALTPKTPSSSSKPFDWNDVPSLQLNIKNGKLLVDDTISDQRYQVADLKIEFQRAISNTDPVKCDASFIVDRILKNQLPENQIPNANKPASGQLAFHAELDPPTSDKTQNGKIDIQAVDVPVALFQPTLQFLLPDLSINAIASAKSNLKIQFKKTGIQLQGITDLNAKNVIVQGSR